MADVQPDRHVRVADLLWDALARYGLTGSQMQCWIVVLGWTWRWRKKCRKRDGLYFRELSYATVAALTGMDRSNVRTLMLELLRLHVLARRDLSDGRYAWAIQKDFEKWLGWPRRPTTMKTKNRQDVVKTTTAERGENDHTPAGSDAAAPGSQDGTLGSNRPRQTGQTGQTKRDREDDRPAELAPFQKAGAELRRPAAKLQDLSEALTKEIDDAAEPLLPLSKKGFPVYTAIGKALKKGRWPIAIIATLKAIDPKGPAKDWWAVWQTQLGIEQSRAEHDAVKEEAKQPLHPDVEKLVAGIAVKGMD